MSKKGCFWGLFLLGGVLLLSACEKRHQSHTSFTRADSLTETYLALQDTMLQVWNKMMHDDNRKIRSMKNLVHELTVSNPVIREDLNLYENRLDELISLRYDQQSLSDPTRVTEYDFASNALVTELITLAESQREFAYNTTLQKLVDSIRAADQRVNNYRVEYDQITMRFNHFIERNGDALEELNDNNTIKKKPLFEVAKE